MSITQDKKYVQTRFQDQDIRKPRVDVDYDSMTRKVDMSDA